MTHEQYDFIVKAGFDILINYSYDKPERYVLSNQHTRVVLYNIENIILDKNENISWIDFVKKDFSYRIYSDGETFVLNF